MILTYLQIPVNYPHLRRLLNVRQFGAFFSDIANLSALRVSVIVDEGNIAVVQQHLETGLPVIVAVQTSYLTSYWDEAVSHAIVVVGTDDESVYVNDPAFAAAPRQIDLNEFMAAWTEKDFLYAVIGLDCHRT